MLNPPLLTRCIPQYYVVNYRQSLIRYKAGHYNFICSTKYYGRNNLQLPRLELLGAFIILSWYYIANYRRSLIRYKAEHCNFICSSKYFGGNNLHLPRLELSGAFIILSCEFLLEFGIGYGKYIPDAEI